MVELGGGSLQLVAVEGRRALRSASLALGALRLTERFLPGDGKPSGKAIKRLRAHVSQALGELGWLPETGRRLVAVGGAARNLAAAAQRRTGFADGGVQGFALTVDSLAELVDELAELSPAERGAVPGSSPAGATSSSPRADVSDGARGRWLRRARGHRGRPARGGVPGRHVARQRRAPVRRRARRRGPQPRGPVRGRPPPRGARRRAVAADARLARRRRADAALRRRRELLWAAAMLHDVGMAVTYDDHHKHSHYLIMQGGLPGFDPRERALIALMCRYHRKGTPKLGEWAALADPGDEELLARCATILRLAEHLERGRDRSVAAVRLRPGEGGIDLHVEADGDLTLARWSVERYGDDRSFERVFGRRLLIG